MKTLTCIATVLACIAVATGPVRAEDDEDSAGVGMYHNAVFNLGFLMADVVVTPEDGEPEPPAGTVESSNVVYGYFGLASLDIPSVYGNRHGYEVYMDFVSKPFDMNFAMGFPFTMLTVGGGGPLTTRIGGVIGFGLGWKQAYAYVGGRIAGIVIPEKLDGELNVQWIPRSASTAYIVDDHLRFETLSVKASGFLQLSGGRVIQGYLHYFKRERFAKEESSPLASAVDTEGFGLGLGLVW